MSVVQLDPRLITLLDKNSIIAEQYRNIRAKILLATESSYKKTFLVTSSVPQEGKTLTAANLAISLAQGVNEKVLLIDSDLRQPAMHRTLNLIPEKGLGDYLSDDTPLEEIITPTPVKKLSFIGAGTHVENPSELLSSEKMSAMVMELRSRYPDHFIIFDSPPLIPVADSMMLAKIIDWIIFVVLAGKTPKETVHGALASFDKNSILGVVLNKLEVLPSEYSYKYKYYTKYAGTGGTKKK